MNNKEKAMLFRLITSISLLIFALLMMSGTQVDQALYRSLMVFLILFAGFYLTIFFINVIQESTTASTASSSQGADKGSGSHGTGYDNAATAGNSRSSGAGPGKRRNSKQRDTRARKSNTESAAKSNKDEKETDSSKSVGNEESTKK